MRRAPLKQIASSYRLVKINPILLPHGPVRANNETRRWSRHNKHGRTKKKKKQQTILSRISHLVAKRLKDTHYRVAGQHTIIASLRKPRTVSCHFRTRAPPKPPMGRTGERTVHNDRGEQFLPDWPPNYHPHGKRGSGYGRPYLPGVSFCEQ